MVRRFPVADDVSVQEIRTESGSRVMHDRRDRPGGPVPSPRKRQFSVSYDRETEHDRSASTGPVTQKDAEIDAVDRAIEIEVRRRIRRAPLDQELSEILAIDTGITIHIA